MPLWQLGHRAGRGNASAGAALPELQHSLCFPERSPGRGCISLEGSWARSRGPAAAHRSALISTGAGGVRCAGLVAPNGPSSAAAPALWACGVLLRALGSCNQGLEGLDGKAGCVKQLTIPTTQTYR